MAYITFQPNDHFNTKLYTGNGSTQNITGVGHQVDWTWIKYRTDTEGHGLFDVLRGALYRIQSNSNGVSSSQSGTVTAFGSDGFSLGSNAEVNANNGSFVSWNWKANGQGSSNTDGTINSTYTSANTTSGFSIVSYTGTNATATVGHGLGVAPNMIIWKELGNSNDWCVWHKSLSATQILVLNSTAATASDSNVMGTLPTSSLFSIGQGTRTNRSGGTYIAYCFAEKKGFSSIGSYIGNGNVNGPMIYTGFKPAFVLLKNTGSYTSATEDWGIYDNKRNTFNEVDEALFASATTVETNVGDGIDFLSNGIKIRDSGGELNKDGDTFIYMVFAEHPFVASNGDPATAR